MVPPSACTAVVAMWQQVRDLSCAGFGGAAAPFGAAQGTGTRGTQFQKTQDTDTGAAGTGGSKSVAYFSHISAMKPYESKSPEELRWEDVQVRYLASLTVLSYHSGRAMPSNFCGHGRQALRGNRLEHWREWGCQPSSKQRHLSVAFQHPQYSARPQALPLELRRRPSV